jgi:ubiquitin C-terminal hydrolase
VLIIHLKRFRSASGLRDKIDAHVTFPAHSLDMAAWISGGDRDGFSNMYDLFGVVNHAGGLHGGL